MAASPVFVSERLICTHTIEFGEKRGLDGLVIKHVTHGGERPNKNES